MSEEEYKLQYQTIDTINEEFQQAAEVDKILENINPATIRAVIYSLVYQHPEVARTVLEELHYYKEKGTF